MSGICYLQNQYFVIVLIWSGYWLTRLANLSTICINAEQKHYLFQFEGLLFVERT